jgi:hypothetical protein
MTNTDRYALEEIASMTLWGEKIKDETLRKEALDAGEYDEDEGVYNPSADSECNMLRDAVETAREAIKREDITVQVLEALKKATWFIENVNDDTPNRTELFFETREAWRKCHRQNGGK